MHRREQCPCERKDKGPFFFCRSVHETTLTFLYPCTDTHPSHVYGAPEVTTIVEDRQTGYARRQEGS